MVDKQIQELINLKEKYIEEKININDELLRRKEDINNHLYGLIEDSLDKEGNSPRLQSYLEKTKIANIEFLYRSMNYMRGNNRIQYLSSKELLLLDPQAKEIAASYEIFSANDLFDIFINYNYLKKNHPILQDEYITNMLNKVLYLAYIDSIFRRTEVVLDHQGAYVTYKYVKDYLKKVLDENSKDTDKDLIYKDYDKKIAIVTNNLREISSELLKDRESIPGSRLAVGNQALKRNANKKENSPLTFEQRIFVEGIAYGTTLEKLENHDYEDAKKLLYIPYQNIIK